jgi:peroxin-14
VARRDWRDWFIMATVMGGISYGVYTVSKRYIYPMIAPPTPEKLEQDKKAIADQFDKTFALVEQLARDTEALKAAEQDRTERLDTALSELESVITELKSANRRREDDAQRVREEIRTLKESIPAALDAQKGLADSRLKEVNSELLSLKTLITRMNTQSPPSTGTGGYSRQTNGNVGGGAAEQTKASIDTSHDNTESDENGAQLGAPEPKASGRSSPLSSGNATGKVSIPAWQLAMSNGNGGGVDAAP